MFEPIFELLQIDNLLNVTCIADFLPAFLKVLISLILFLKILQFIFNCPKYVMRGV